MDRWRTIERTQLEVERMTLEVERIAQRGNKPIGLTTLRTGRARRRDLTTVENDSPLNRSASGNDEGSAAVRLRTWPYLQCRRALRSAIHQRRSPGSIPSLALESGLSPLTSLFNGATVLPQTYSRSILRRSDDRVRGWHGPINSFWALTDSSSDREGE